MTETADWKQQVAEWRVSGLSAEEFSKARGYPRTRLWAWSSRLLKAERKVSVGDDVRLVQVVRENSRSDSVAVTVHLHDARVLVPTGIDRGTLAMVLDAVDDLRRPSRRAGR